MRDGTAVPKVDYSAEIISIHPPLAGRDAASGHNGAAGLISIHPPLAGRDTYSVRELAAVHSISIHPPLAGRDMLIPSMLTA